MKQANDDELGPIDGLEVLAGNDSGFLATLKFGGAGGILVASHLDNGRMRTIWDLWQEGDIDEAEALDNQLQPLYEAMGVVVNPIPVKAALASRGLIPPTMRLPMVEPTDKERDAVEELLSRGRSACGMSDDKIKLLPLGGLGEIGKNMIVVEYRGKIVRGRHRPDVPDPGNARHRPRPARLRLPARPGR